MGEKVVELQTGLEARQCVDRFRSAIQNGRGASAMIGGFTAKLMGGETLTWYVPEHDGPFDPFAGDQPTQSIAVAVPKAYGAHMHGTNLHMYVWDRGGHRDVTLLAHHSITGGQHAEKLLAAVTSSLET